MSGSGTIQITKWHLDSDSTDTTWYPKLDQYSRRRITNRGNTASLSTGHDCSKRGASIATHKNSVIWDGTRCTCRCRSRSEKLGASVSRLIFISPLATLRGWRAEVAGRWVSADLTRGTNKFDGTPIRNSTYLSMAMGLIWRYSILIAHKTWIIYVC